MIFFFDEWLKKRLDQEKPQPAPASAPAPAPKIVDTTPVWWAFIEALDRDTPKLRNIAGFNVARVQLPDSTKGSEQPCSMSVNYNEPRNLEPYLAILYFHHRGSKIECHSHLRPGRPILTMGINEADSTISFDNKWDTPETAAGRLVVWVSEALSGGRHL